MIRLTEAPIDVRALEAALGHPGAGAVLSFQGVTRDSFQGRPVLELWYEAWPEMALAALEQIRDEAQARWPGARLALVHRLGRVGLGEASVVIAVSAPHRDEAYAASRFAIDALKARVPIWKKETYADGAAWKENAEGLPGPRAVAGETLSEEGEDPDTLDPSEIGRTFAAPSTDGRPAFKTRDLDLYPNQELNPYLRLHQELRPEVLTSEEAPGFRGRWGDAFQRPGPLHVEIGPGNGFFFSGMAARHPEQNWLGVEIRFKRVVLTARKARAAGVENARVVRYDARFLHDLFAPGEIDGLYVNHPDPWEKKKKAKHRLLCRPFAEWAVAALRPGGLLRIKTDYHPNLDLFEELIVGLPLRRTLRVEDIVAMGSPWGEDDVETNYQSKFRKRGLPVAAMELVRLSDPEGT